MAARFKLDEIDHKILDMLIENTRMPFTDIAKALEVSAGTVHIRVRKMEESGIIKSSTLTVDYDKIGYTFVAYVGIFLEKNHQTQFVISHKRASSVESTIYCARFALVIPSMRKKLSL